MGRLKSYRSLLALGILLCLGSFLSIGSVRAGTYRIYRKSQWENWTFPKGVVKLEADGRLNLVRLHARKDSLNACLDADEFKHWSIAKKDSITGGIKEARSNRWDAGKIIDGDYNTYWSPDQGDDLEDWWIEVDLGRAVAAAEVRLVFADQEGARPFRDFSVYKSDGARIYAGSDIVEYTLVGKTTRPNTSSVVRYELGFCKTDTTRAGGEVTRALDFDQVQYVRIILDSKSETPALAELEVYTLGDNIALGTDQRGGSLVVHCYQPKGHPLYDGDLTTNWLFPLLTDENWDKGTGTDPDAGPYFEWDLGNLFWLNQIVLWFGGPGFAMGRYGSATYAEGYIIATSDGSKTTEGKFDYELVADVWNRDMPYQYNFSHGFERRKVRYIFFRHAHGTGNWRSRANSGAMLHELQIFGEGYPARVVLTSNFIDLVGSKNITSLEWDAVAPKGTRVEVRSRSGNTMEVVKHWYNHWGQEITEAAYYKLPPPMRGEITEEIRLPDWSSWSQVYDWSGQSFLSPSPRRYTQLELALVSDDPDTCLTLNSLSINYTDPWIKGVMGEITPRFAPADLPQDFVYTVSSLRGYRDTGFDRVMINVPSPVDSSDVSLRVNGVSVPPKSIIAGDDSLVLDIAEVVQAHRVTMREGTIRKGLTTFVVREDLLIAGRDTLALYGAPVTIQGSRVTIGSTRITVRGGSVTVADSTLLSGTITLEGDSLAVHNDPVEIGFKCRFIENCTLLDAFVGNSAKPGLWQRIDPVRRKATTVALPSLPASDDLIGNLSITPRIITPNGDGANDEMTISFSIFKVNKPAKVTIYDLRGEMIKELEPASGNPYVWDGRDSSGERVAPGIYVCQIHVDADAGDNTATRTVGVAY